MDASFVNVSEFVYSMERTGQVPEFLLLDDREPEEVIETIEYFDTLYSLH